MDDARRNSLPPGCNIPMIAVLSLQSPVIYRHRTHGRPQPANTLATPSIPNVPTHSIPNSCLATYSNGRYHIFDHVNFMPLTAQRHGRPIDEENRYNAIA
jgi:hypothetical protein